jgi:hypothetical protein
MMPDCEGMYPGGFGSAILAIIGRGESRSLMNDLQATSPAHCAIRPARDMTRAGRDTV